MSGGCRARQHIWAPRTGWVPAAGRRGASMRDERNGGERESMSTRTLLILAAITGVAILTAGAVQILLAR
jgi:hypothetical protein